MPSHPPRLYTTHNAEADATIAQLLRSVSDTTDKRLLSEAMASVYRLGADRSATGDLKIINAALKELRYAFKIFRPYRHIRKVAMFGSARLPKSHAAYALAMDFGARMARANWMVITGAASGIMRAGHEGAGKDASFGLNIRLPFEQGANEFIAKDKKLVTCKYFFTRKLLFIKESHATALFPGGFGTLDEGFESLTLVQTGKSDPRPVVFVDTPRGTFWQPLLSFMEHRLVRGGMVSASDRWTFQVARSAEDAVNCILRFYSTYHSLRYVGERLVLRLQRPLPPTALTLLAREFGDMLASGAFQEGSALPEEADETDLHHLPRLIFRYNRREFGRLVQLIHRINDLGADAASPGRL